MIFYCLSDYIQYQPMYFPQTYNIDYRRFSVSSLHIIWYHLHEKKTKWITYSLLFFYTQNMSERAYKKHNSGCLREEELSVAHSERVFMGSRIVLLPQIMATKKATNKSSHLLGLSILPSTPTPLPHFLFLIPQSYTPPKCSSTLLRNLSKSFQAD